MMLSALASAAAASTDAAAPHRYLAPTPHRIAIGDAHQAQLPVLQEVVPSPAKRARVDNPYDVAPLWQPQRLAPDVVQDYLDFVKQLFASKGTPSQFCEVRALHLLRECDYDVDQARHLLTVWGEPEEEGITQEVDGSVIKADEFCLVCKDGGDLILCDDPNCRSVFHPACCNLERLPTGLWICPFHKCTVCGVDVTNKSNYCSHCPTSFCEAHLPPSLGEQLKHHDVPEFLCPACLESDMKEFGTGRQAGRFGFIKRLRTVLQRCNINMPRPPEINGRAIDLVVFYKEVLDMGGLAKAVEGGGAHWTKLRRLLRLDQKISAPMAEIALRKVYEDCLLAYERKCFHLHAPLQGNALSEEQLQRLRRGGSGGSGVQMTTVGTPGHGLVMIGSFDDGRGGGMQGRRRMVVAKGTSLAAAARGHSDEDDGEPPSDGSHVDMSTEKRREEAKRNQEANNQAREQRAAARAAMAEVVSKQMAEKKRIRREKALVRAAAKKLRKEKEEEAKKEEEEKEPASGDAPAAAPVVAAADKQE